MSGLPPATLAPGFLGHDELVERYASVSAQTGAKLGSAAGAGDMDSIAALAIRNVMATPC
jgi:hypothetical protein